MEGLNLDLQTLDGQHISSEITFMQDFIIQLLQVIAYVGLESLLPLQTTECQLYIIHCLRAIFGINSWNC